MEAISTRPSLDQLLDYEATHFPNPGRCRLRTFAEVRVAVVTELEDNPGPSVTNAIEDVAMAVGALLDVRFFGTSWRLIEHYPAHRYRFVDRQTVDLVTFRGYDQHGRLIGPMWQPAPGAMDWLREALASAA